MPSFKDESVQVKDFTTRSYVLSDESHWHTYRRNRQAVDYLYDLLNYRTPEGCHFRYSDALKAVAAHFFIAPTTVKNLQSKDKAGRLTPPDTECPEWLVQSSVLVPPPHQLAGIRSSKQLRTTDHPS